MDYGNKVGIIKRKLGDKCLKAKIDELSSMEGFRLMLSFATQAESKYSFKLARFA